MLKAVAEPPAAFLFKLLLSVLKEVEKYADGCDQYFQLLEHLMKDYEGKDLPELLSDFANKVINHPIVEVSSVSDEDKVLIGVINLIYAIVRKDSSFKQQCAELKVLEEVLNNCLFAVPVSPVKSGPYGAKCKTKNSRQACFRLLTELARDCPENFKDIIDLLNLQLRSRKLDRKYCAMCNTNPS